MIGLFNFFSIRKRGIALGVKRSDRRPLILAAARELFREKGFADTSLREIAKIAGVSASAISYYFKSKEGLYRELYPDGAEQAPDSRACIIAAAQRLFAAEGYARVSIRDIAEEAGVSSSAISYYFGGKAELYREVLYRGTSLISEFMDRVSEGNPEPGDILRLYGDFLMRCGCERPEVMHLIFRELMNGTDVFSGFVKNRLKRMIDVQRHALLDGRESGLYRNDLRAEVVSMSWAGMVLFYHMAHGIMTDLLPNEEEPTPKEYMDIVWEVLMNGIKETGNAKSEEEKVKGKEEIGNGEEGGSFDE